MFTGFGLLRPAWLLGNSLASMVWRGLFVYEVWHSVFLLSTPSLASVSAMSVPMMHVRALTLWMCIKYGVL